MHIPLKLLSDDESHFKFLMGDYMRLTVSPDPLLETMKNFNCHLLWGQVSLLSPSTGNLASTYGMFCNHKIEKKVLFQRRCILKESHVETGSN